MTLELNVFNIYKQSEDNNDLHEVDFINKFVHEQFGFTFLSDPLEVCLTTSNELEPTIILKFQIYFFR